MNAPEVTAIVAISLDGRITRHDAPGTAFTSTADQRWFADCLKDFDCSIMGRATFDAAREGILRKTAHYPADRLRVIQTRSPHEYTQWHRPDRLEFSNALPAALLQDLHRREFQRCALLGGADLYSAYAQADLIDGWWITLEPRLFGTGRPVVESRMDPALKLISVERLPDSNSLLLKYRRG